MAPPSIDDRMRVVEQRVAVHEAVCSERYKALTVRLNIAIALLLVVVTALAADNAIMSGIKRISGG